MRKYVRRDENGRFRRRMHEVDAESRTPPIKPVTSPESGAPQQAAPTQKASCTQLLERFRSAEGNRENLACEGVELAGLIAGGAQGWEDAVDTLVDWMGHEDVWGKRKHNAFYCLKDLVRDEEPLPQVRSAIVEKLRNARNDVTHPFRELDAGKLLADAAESPAGMISEFQKASTGSWAGVANTLALQFMRLASSNPPEAVFVMESAAPALLDMLAEREGRGAAERLDQGAAYAFFETAYERMPDETLQTLIKAGSVEEEADWMPDERRGPYAVGTIVNLLAKEDPFIAPRLAKQIFVDDKFAHLTLKCLEALGDEGTEAVIKEGMESKDGKILLATGLTLASLGPQALEKLFDHMSEQSNDKTLMLGLGMLAGPLQIIAKGSSSPAAQKRLAGVEATLRQNAKLQALIRKAEESQDGGLNTQAQLIKTLIEAM